MTFYTPDSALPCGGGGGKFAKMFDVVMLIFENYEPRFNTGVLNGNVLIP